MSDYYEKRFAEFGEDVRSLGWGSVESQRIRFKVLTEIAPLGGHTVLDYGCGFGDLFAYMGRPARYIGYDNNPQFLGIARRKHPTGRFVDKPQAVDYVLASGLLNLPDLNVEVRDLWDLAWKGIAVNFTSSLAERKTDDIVYCDPSRILSYLTQMTNKFTLRHDYRQNDFTIYAYR